MCSHVLTPLSSRIVRAQNPDTEAFDNPGWVREKAYPHQAWGDPTPRSPGWTGSQVLTCLLFDYDTRMAFEILQYQVHVKLHGVHAKMLFFDPVQNPFLLRPFFSSTTFIYSMQHDHDAALRGFFKQWQW